MDTPTDSKASLIIVEKYESFFNYLYPMLINTSRQHRILRDVALTALLNQYQLFRDAGKSFSRRGKVTLSMLTATTFKKHLGVL